MTSQFNVVRNLDLHSNIWLTLFVEFLSLLSVMLFKNALSNLHCNAMKSRYYLINTITSPQ